MLNIMHNYKLRVKYDILALRILPIWLNMRKNVRNKSDICCHATSINLVERTCRYLMTWSQSLCTYNARMLNIKLYKYWNDNSRQKPHVWVMPS